MAGNSIVVVKLLDDISEDLPIGTPVAEISMSQPTTDEITYQIITKTVDLNGNIYDDDSFRLEGNLIVTTKQFDFEVMTYLGRVVGINAAAYSDDGLLSQAGIAFAISDVMENLIGTSKFDKLAGGPGSDKIIAGAGNDLLNGNSGNDILYGGLGQDILTGGTGADIFLFKSVRESSVNAPDLITDWHHVGGDPVRDLIDLRAIDADTKQAGNQAFDWIATKSFTGHAGELRYEKLTSGTYIYADVNGDKKADFAIHIENAVKLYKDDFLV